MNTGFYSENVSSTHRSNKDNVDFVKSYKPRNNKVKHLRILLHGPAGAGKSSFINSVDSVLQGRVTGRVPTDATSEKTFTEQVRITADCDYSELFIRTFMQFLMYVCIISVHLQTSRSGTVERKVKLTSVTAVINIGEMPHPQNYSKTDLHKPFQHMESWNSQHKYNFCNLRLILEGNSHKVMKFLVKA